MAADEAGGGGLQDGMLEAACNYVFVTVDMDKFGLRVCIRSKSGRLKLRQIKKGCTNTACFTRRFVL